MRIFGGERLRRGALTFDTRHSPHSLQSQVERAKLEPPSQRGQLQSTCYAFRFFGMMVAAPISTLLYDLQDGARYIVILLACVPPLIMGPCLTLLHEIPPTRTLSIKHECSEIWNSVCSRAVWQPMAFVYIYNILRVPNAAWRQFLKTVLGFTADELNALLIAAYVLLYLGTLAYKFYFIRYSWRCIYQTGILLNCIFSSFQILLIKGKTFGLSPFLFALGDDVFQDFIAGLQFLVRCRLSSALCIVSRDTCVELPF